jgi:rhodanese-related sulfurtransferase
LGKSHSPGFLAIVADAKTRIREETAAEALLRLKESPRAVLVDVREDREFNQSHVAGAVHLSKGIIERDVESLYPDKSVELHLYCGGGFRSALVADNLQKMGYTNVFSIDGGVRALEAAGARMELGPDSESAL